MDLSFLSTVPGRFQEVVISSRLSEFGVVFFFGAKKINNRTLQRRRRRWLLLLLLLLDFLRFTARKGSQRVLQTQLPELGRELLLRPRQAWKASKGCGQKHRCICWWLVVGWLGFLVFPQIYYGLFFMVLRRFVDFSFCLRPLVSAFWFSNDFLLSPVWRFWDCVWRLQRLPSKLIRSAQRMHVSHVGLTFERLENATCDGRQENSNQQPVGHWVRSVVNINSPLDEVQLRSIFCYIRFLGRCWETECCKSECRPRRRPFVLEDFSVLSVFETKWWILDNQLWDKRCYSEKGEW